MSIITPRSKLLPPLTSTGTPGSSDEIADARVPLKWLSRIRQWLENDRARRELARCLALDPRFARDIGLSPNDVYSISSAPFWVGITRLR